MAREYHKTAGEAKTQFLTGQPMEYPMHQLGLGDNFATINPVDAVPTEDGRAQAAVGFGGFGRLVGAGRP